MIDSITKEALTYGASLAGIVGLDEGVATRVALPAGVASPIRRGSLLVLALAHDEDRPELDWWGGPSGTEGNRRLQAIAARLQRALADEYGLRARPLTYHPWKGGVLLKDAAALAGLGVIGANNLLITPEYGPRVRLKAMLLGGWRESGAFPKTPDSSPCDGCPRPCWAACPQDAFCSGKYDRDRCALQMARDEAGPPTHADPATGVSYIEYCRACELACPVAK